MDKQFSCIIFPLLHTPNFLVSTILNPSLHAFSPPRMIPCILYIWLYNEFQPLLARTKATPRLPTVDHQNPVAILHGESLCLWTLFIVRNFKKYYIRHISEIRCVPASGEERKTFFWVTTEATTRDRSRYRNIAFLFIQNSGRWPISTFQVILSICRDMTCRLFLYFLKYGKRTTTQNG
jgi:hypothetical protein